MRKLIFALVVLSIAGCGSQSGPTLAHGQPVEHWVKALSDSDAKARKRAADVLGNVGAADATVVPALATAVGDRDRAVREAAVVALLKLGPAAKEALPALTRASNDLDPTIRKHALKAMEKLRDAP